MANALIPFLFRALVTLAYAGGHSCLAVNMDFRIRENDGQVFFSFLFRVNPWQMHLFWLVCFSFPCKSVANASFYLPSLTLPALISLLFRALVTLAYAGVHSCIAVNMDFRIRENDGKGFFLTICPWQMLIFRFPSLTLPALIKSFVSVFVRGK